MTLTKITVLTLVTLMVLTLAMLACGPADEAVQRELGNMAGSPQEEEGDAEPTAVPTARDYPNLDETLQALVRKYELRELTAEQAAAEAFVYEGSKVLIRVALSSSGNTSVDSWMGTQDINPRAQVDYSGGIIYAYAEVSVLGALSQQAGLTKVHAEPAFLGGAIFGEQLPSVETQAEGRSTRPTTNGGLALPQWLKGHDTPSEELYRKMEGSTAKLATMELEGTITDAVLAEYGDCITAPRKLLVGVLIENNKATETALRSWITGKGGTVETTTYEEDNNQLVLEAHVPTNRLIGLAGVAGVVKLYGCDNWEASSP